MYVEYMGGKIRTQISCNFLQLVTCPRDENEGKTLIYPYIPYLLLHYVPK